MQSKAAVDGAFLRNDLLPWRLTEAMTDTHTDARRHVRSLVSASRRESRAARRQARRQALWSQLAAIDVFGRLTLRSATLAPALKVGAR
jgi:hypothetical protein